MCTVTFCPNGGGFLLTFSRDERQSRPTLFPKYYQHNDLELLYPKDNLAGGTWFATSSSGKTTCLLNGAFTNHVRESSYERSRGILVLESFYFTSIHEFVINIDLCGVEPFTMLLMEPNGNKELAFFELTWDGKQKHFKALNTSMPQIWSSSTLYDTETQAKRKELFYNWYKLQEEVSPEDIFSFQSTRHGLSESKDFIMQGAGDLKTLSLTQLNFNATQLKYRHRDLINGISATFDLQEKGVTNV